MSKRVNVLLTALVITGFLALPAGAADLGEQQIRAYYTAWSSGDLDGLMSYFAEDAVYEDVATGDLSTGKANVRIFAAKFLEDTPGVRVVPTSVLVGDGAAAVEWTMSAGAGDEAWSVRGVAIIKHAGGKITRATDYWNKE
jgi:steroid delta-isomerase-like uncharacterized protein